LFFLDFVPGKPVRHGLGLGKIRMDVILFYKALGNRLRALGRRTGDHGKKYG
jgi:hypothetical protein